MKFIKDIAAKIRSLLNLQSRDNVLFDVGYAQIVESSLALEWQSGEDNKAYNDL